MIIIETNVIKNMDCIEGMNRISNKSIDMILCDLPYGTTKCEWDNIIPFNKLWEQYERIIKDNAVIILFGSQPFTSELVMSNKEMFRYELIWEKVQGRQPQLCNIMPMKAHENILIFYKNTAECKYDSNKYKTLRDYFYNEKQRLKLTYKDINKALGTATNGGGMASHYFNLNFKQWSLPTKEMYIKLQSTFKDGFKKNYTDLKKEYDNYEKQYDFGIKYNPQFWKGKSYNKKVQKEYQGKNPIAGFNNFKGLAKNNQTLRYPVSYLRFKNPKHPVHPTQKPVDLCEWLIKTYSNENDIILDNCMGSGTTAIACLKTNRRYIGFENDKTYYDLCQNRIDTYLSNNK